MIINEKLTIDEKSLLYKIMNKNDLIGQYRCNYGFNQEYSKIFEHSTMKAVAKNNHNQVRAFELKNHPFFLGTLFLPQLDFSKKNSYQIIEAFIKALL